MRFLQLLVCETSFTALDPVHLQYLSADHLDVLFRAMVNLKY